MSVSQKIMPYQKRKEHFLAGSPLMRKHRFASPKVIFSTMRRSMSGASPNISTTLLGKAMRMSPQITMAGLTFSVGVPAAGIVGVPTIVHTIRCQIPTMGRPKIVWEANMPIQTGAVSTASQTVAMNQNYGLLLMVINGIIFFLRGVE